MTDKRISDLVEQTSMTDTDVMEVQPASGDDHRITWANIKIALGSIFSPVKLTGTEINTGTDDSKYATAKAIADSRLVKGPSGASIDNTVVGFDGTSAKLIKSLGLPYRVAYAKYDFALDGGMVGVITPPAVRNTVIPIGAMIPNESFHCVTALTSGGLATIKVGMGAGAADNILHGVEDYTFWTLNYFLPWSSSFRMTAPGSIIFTIAGANLTAGSIEVFIPYFLAP
jgi:hypothetical protein